MASRQAAGLHEQPLVGGVATSFIAELLAYPAIYFVWRSIGLEEAPLFPAAGGASDRSRSTGTDGVPFG